MTENSDAYLHLALLARESKTIRKTKNNKNNEQIINANKIRKNTQNQKPQNVRIGTSCK